MTYQEKMAQAIAKAEKWQGYVDAIEKQHENLANARLEGEIRANGKVPQNKEAVILAYMKTTLKDDGVYHSACANRNAAQTLAQMYGTAALVAAQYGMVTQ